jgi:hypothetical protein
MNGFMRSVKCDHATLGSFSSWQDTDRDHGLCTAQLEPFELQSISQAMSRLPLMFTSDYNDNDLQDCLSQRRRDAKIHDIAEFQGRQSHVCHLANGRKQLRAGMESARRERKGQFMRD